MKITRREVIKEGEQELIDAITGELDWGAIEEIFEKEHRLKMSDDVTYESGDIVIHNNQVAYRLEFDVKMTLSLLLDRDGSCLSLASSADLDPADGIDEDHPPDGMESPPASAGDSQAPEDGDTPEPSGRDPSDSTGDEGDEGDVAGAGDGDDTDAKSETSIPQDVKERISQAASDASDMISEINSDTP